MLPILAIAMISFPTSDLADKLRSFRADESALGRKYPIEYSTARSDRFRLFYSEALTQNEKENFDRLDSEGKIDWILFQNYLRHELRQLDIDAGYRKAEAGLLPFADQIIALEEARRRFETIDSPKTAQTLTDLTKQVDQLRKDLEAKPPKTEKATANRAARNLAQLQRHLGDWYKYFDGYEPMFTWWCERPYAKLAEALDSYGRFLKEKLVGVKPDDKTTIIGFPIGREALLAELEYEMIPYSPEELIDIANKEFAWCEAEFGKAAAEMKLPPKQALEKVKQSFVEPGKQPELIRNLAEEAIEFVEKRNLVTVPALCKETWRMEMMSPEAQLQSPFFLGGEQILVSYPTNTMDHEAKLMSLRGNNPNFSRATVQHELIPGHHLQGYMLQRFSTQREMFGTPFWIEGWALYWEMRLWDLGFPRTPEEKIGMLFWRMHRCARIIFSLSFHLGKMTAQQCVDFLVDKVGHERDNAAAEVRRSLAGNYGPLYQAAYMLGGMQIRALHDEMVGLGPDKSGPTRANPNARVSEREFHDAILQGGQMPIEMVRARLERAKLTKDFKTSWQFAG